MFSMASEFVNDAEFEEFADMPGDLLGKAPELHCDAALVYDEVKLVTDVVNKTRRIDADYSCVEPPLEKSGRTAYTSGLILGHLVRESVYKHMGPVQMDDGHRSLFYTAPDLMGLLFDNVVQPRFPQYAFPVDAFGLGATAGHDVARGTMKGLVETSMKYFDAAKQVSDQLNELRVNVHVRANQYSKSCALLSFLLDRMDTLLPLKAIVKRRDVKGEIKRRVKTKCWDSGVLKSPVEGVKDLLLAYWCTRDHMIVRVQGPEDLAPPSLYSRKPPSMQTWFLLPRVSLLCARDVTIMRRNVFQACFQENEQRKHQLPTTAALEGVLSSFDTLLSMYGEAAYDAIDLHEAMSLCTFFDEYEVLQTNNQEYKSEIHTKFREALVGNGEASDENIELHLRDVEGAIRGCRSPAEYCEVFGLNRLWGYSIVQERASFEKCRELMTESPALDEIGKLWASRIRGAAIRRFCTTYQARHGHLPALDLSKRPPCEVLHRWFTQRTAEVDLHGQGAPTDDEWSFVELDWHLLFDEILDPAALLDDKAVCVPRDEIGSFFRSPILGVPIKSLHSRRLLLEIWSTRKLDMSQLLEKVSSLTVDHQLLVYAMVSKEKCTNLIGRLFTYTTPTIRAFYSTLEKNIKDSVFPLTPSQTMTMSETQLHKRLMKVKSNKKGKKRSWVVQISLDFKKWCQHFTVENTAGITDFLDAIFGFKARDMKVYRHAQVLAGMCLFFLGSRTNPPEDLVLTDEERHLPHNERLTTFYKKFKAFIRRLLAGSKEGDLAFFSTGRLGEGTLQKLWTHISVHIAEAVAHLERIEVELIGQGDNQVLEVDFPIPDDCPAGWEYRHPFLSELETRVKEFMVRLNTATSALRLPLKERETWASLVLKIYGKRWVCGGAIMSQILKRIARASGDSNSIVPETAEVVAMAAATGLSACAASTSFVTPYLVSCAAACAEYMRDMVCCTASITLAHACPGTTRAVFANTADAYTKVFKPAHAAALKSDKGLASSPLVSLLRMFLLHTTPLGGLPVVPLSRFFMKKWPDPLTEIGVVLKMAARGGISEARRLYWAFEEDQCLWKLLSDDVTRNCEAVVRNPDSLVINEIKDPARHVKEATRKGLASIDCMNSDYSVLVDERLDKEDKENCTLLATLQPFSPRIASELWSLTSPAVAEMCLSAFNSPSTFSHLTKTYKELVQSVTETSLGNSRFRMRMLTLALSVTPGPVVSCVTDWAQSMRVRCYGKGVDGVTTPHPWEQCTYRTAPTHDPYPDEHGKKIPYMILQVDPMSRVPTSGVHAYKTSSGLMRSHARGTRDPYLGSETSRWTANQSIKARKSDRPVRDALRACVDAQWFTEPDSQLREYIDRGIVRARVGLTLKEGLVHSGRNSAGCTTHRLCEVRGNHGAELNCLATFTTCMTLLTNGLADLCRSHLQWVMVLQAWAVCAMAMEINAAASIPLEQEEARYNVFVTLNCGARDGMPPAASCGCCLTGYNGVFEIKPKQSVARIAFRSSRLLYAAAEELRSMYVRPTIVPVATCMELPNASVAEVLVAEAGAGQKLFEIGRMAETVSAAVVQNVNRSPPPLRLRDFVKLSLHQVVEAHAQKLLECSLGYLLRKVARVSQSVGKAVLIGRMLPDRVFTPYLPLVTIPGKREEFDALVIRSAKSSGASVQHTSVAQTLRDLISVHVVKWLEALKEGRNLHRAQFCFYKQGSGAPSFATDLATHVILNTTPELRAREPPMYLSEIAHVWSVLRGKFQGELRKRVDGTRVGITDEGFAAALNEAAGGCPICKVVVKEYAGLRRRGRCAPMHVTHTEPEYAVTLTQHGDDEDEITGYVGEILAAPLVTPALVDKPVLKPLFFTDKSKSGFLTMPIITDGVQQSVVVNASLGTNSSRGCRAEVVLKLMGSHSTAQYKLLYMLARLGLTSVRYAMTLAEGLGGGAALLSRLESVVGVFYQTLDPGLIDGCQDSWTPVCVATEGCPSKMLSLRQAMAGPTDLRQSDTVEHVVALALRSQKVREKELSARTPQEGYDVLTCDIFCPCSALEAVSQNYIIARNVACIASRCLRASGIALFKCFSIVPVEFQATLYGLSCHFSSLSVLTNPFSGHENSEQYIVCRGPRQATGTMVRHSDGSIEVTTLASTESIKQAMAATSRSQRFTRCIRPAMESAACLQVMRYLESAEYGARVRGRTTAANLFQIPYEMIPNPTHPCEPRHKEKKEAAKTALVTLLYGVLESAREIISDINYGLRVGYGTAEGYASADIQRSLKLGRRRYNTPRHESDKACLAVLVMRLLAENPETPEEYERLIETSVRKPIMIDTKLKWEANLTEVMFAQYGRSIAQIYAAYGSYSQKVWLSDRRNGTALFASGGVRGFTDYDNVRHSPEAAAHISYLLLAVIKEQEHNIMYDIFGGRGSIMEALVGHVTECVLDKLVVRSNRKKEYSQHARRGLRAITAELDLAFSLSTSSTLQEALQQRCLLWADLVWAESEDVLGNTFRNHISLFLEAGCTVCYTAALGHEGYIIPNSHTCVRVTAGRVFVCVSPTLLELPAGVYARTVRPRY